MTSNPTTRRSKRLHAAIHKRAPQNRHGEYSDRTRNKFFEAIDERGTKKKSEIYQKKGIPARTASFWLKQRELLNSPTKHRTRPLSNKLGRPLKDPSIYPPRPPIPRNPVRHQQYETQIEEHSIPVHKRTLRKNLQCRTRNARLYKKGKVKAISSKNREARVRYG